MCRLVTILFRLLLRAAQPVASARTNQATFDPARGYAPRNALLVLSVIAESRARRASSSFVGTLAFPIPYAPPPGMPAARRWDSS